jgi:hypothetical protein
MTRPVRRAAIAEVNPVFVSTPERSALEQVTAEERHRSGYRHLAHTPSEGQDVSHKLANEGGHRRLFAHSDPDPDAPVWQDDAGGEAFLRTWFAYLVRKGVKLSNLDKVGGVDTANGSGSLCRLTDAHPL